MSDADVFIHETAVVDEGAKIGGGSKIWHFCHVMGGAQVGSRVNMGQNVFVAATAIIGDGVKIQNNVSIYDGVILEEDVFLGPSCVFTNVSHPRSAVNRRGQYAQTLVCRGATVGANATIVCGRTIGAFAFVAAGAVVTHDVAAHALVMGVPAEQRGWVCACGETLRGEDVFACEGCGGRYVVSPSGTLESEG